MPENTCKWMENEIIETSLSQLTLYDKPAISFLS